MDAGGHEVDSSTSLVVRQDHLKTASKPLTKSQEWFKHLVSETDTVLKLHGFKKRGKATWVSHRDHSVLMAGFQKSTTTKADYLRWFFWSSTECPDVRIGDDFEPPDWRGFTAGWSSRMSDPEGIIRPELLKLMKERYPDVPVPVGPHRKEAWDIASDDEVATTVSRFINEIQTVALPELERLANIEELVCDWEERRVAGRFLSVGQLELLRLGNAFIYQKSNQI